MCVQQVLYILSDSEFLSAFHKKRNMIFGLKIEPWELPGGLGFVRKRRCIYTAPIQGPAWFRTMLGIPSLGPSFPDGRCFCLHSVAAHQHLLCCIFLRAIREQCSRVTTRKHAGGQNLVEMLDVQEMMYDPESGCMLVQIDSFMLLDGGASKLRMRHMQWLFQPVMSDDHLEICEVRGKPARLYHSIDSSCAPVLSCGARMPMLADNCPKCLIWNDWYLCR